MAATEGERRDRAGGVVADPGQRDQVVVRRRHLAVVPLHDRRGGGVQAQRAAGVAEPAPRADRLAAGRRRRGRRASARSLIQLSKTGSTRATGVCWSMNSETITAHGVAPGRARAARGRARRTSRRIGSCRSFISAAIEVHPGTVSAAQCQRAGHPGHVRTASAPSALHHDRRRALTTVARMGSVRHPRGRLPRRVYWVRRSVVLGVALLLVFGIGRLLGGTGEDDPGSTIKASTTSAEQQEPPRRRSRWVRWPRRRSSAAQGQGAARCRRAVSAATTRSACCRRCRVPGPAARS